MVKENQNGVPKKKKKAPAWAATASDDDDNMTGLTGLSKKKKKSKAGADTKMNPNAPVKKKKPVKKKDSTRSTSSQSTAASTAYDDERAASSRNLGGASSHSRTGSPGPGRGGPAMGGRGRPSARNFGPGRGPSSRNFDGLGGGSSHSRTGSPGPGMGGRGRPSTRNFGPGGGLGGGSSHSRTGSPGPGMGGRGRPSTRNFGPGDGLGGGSSHSRTGGPGPGRGGPRMMGGRGGPSTRNFGPGRGPSTRNFDELGGGSSHSRGGSPGPGRGGPRMMGGRGRASARNMGGRPGPGRGRMGRDPSARPSPGRAMPSFRRAPPMHSIHEDQSQRNMPQSPTRRGMSNRNLDGQGSNHGTRMNNRGLSSSEHIRRPPMDDDDDYDYQDGAGPRRPTMGNRAASMMNLNSNTNDPESVMGRWGKLGNNAERPGLKKAGSRSGILRNSGHGTGGSSHHSRTPSRRSLNQNPQQGDDDYDDDYDEDATSVEEVSINFEPGEGRRGNMRKSNSKSSLGSLDLSNHSGYSSQSTLTIDVQSFENDPPIKKALRYVRILPPKPNEKPIKKRIRILTWWALVLDFIAAIVSITTFGEVAQCCGEPVFELVSSAINWNDAVRYMTYVYLGCIFLEVIPVVRNGLPFNLINPMLGFSITFAMFFDDDILEAACMWTLEATAIFFEFLVYRMKYKIYRDRIERLDRCIEELAEISRVKTIRRLRGDSNHSRNTYYSNDDDSYSGDSWGPGDTEIGNWEDSFAGNESERDQKRREFLLLRERRVLRLSKKTEIVALRYHFIGVMINVVLVATSLSLIIAIANNGGLCVQETQRPVIFSNDQLDRCSKGEDCRTVSGRCEYCVEGERQCYFPYY